jgi:hypothetical protein
VYQVASIKVNAGYNSGTMLNDTALIFISGTANFDVTPVRLNDNAALDAAATTQTILGWGTTSSGGSLSDPLLQAQVTMVSFSTCSSAYGSGKILPDMLCAAAAGRDTCQGDSGGPMVVQSGGVFVQTGITSWGNGCALAGYPGVYASVRQHLRWINANANIGGGVTPPPPPPGPSPSPSASPSATAARSPVAPPPPGTAPLNDARVNATRLSCFPKAVTSSSVGATVEAGEPSFVTGSATLRPYNTVWYSWTAPTNGPFTVHTIGSSYDTVLNVLSSALTRLSSNDDCSTSVRVSCAPFTAVGGVVYLFQVGGYAATDAGTVKVSVRVTGQSD